MSFFLKGLGITFISGSLESLFVESIDHKLLIKYNVVERLVFFSSVAIAAGLGGTLIQYCGYGCTIVMDVIILILTLIIVFQFDEKAPGLLPGELPNTTILCAVRRILHNKVVMILLLIDFANAFAFVAVEDFYSAFLGELGISSDWIGFIMALQFIVSSLFGFFTAKISKRFTPSRILYWMPALRAVLTITIYINHLPLLLIPVIFSLQLTMFTVYAPVKYQLFQKSIESPIRSITLSVQSLVISAGALLFFGLSSILGQIFTISTLLIIALTAAAILLIAAAYLLKEQFSAIISHF